MEGELGFRRQGEAHRGAESGNSQPRLAKTKDRLRAGEDKRWALRKRALMEAVAQGGGFEILLRGRDSSGAGRAERCLSPTHLPFPELSIASCGYAQPSVSISLRPEELPLIFHKLQMCSS